MMAVKVTRVAVVVGNGVRLSHRVGVIPRDPPVDKIDK